MTKHICLFGGPGKGKSILSSEIFSVLKKKGYNVELSHEFAKQLVYSCDTTRLHDQLFVLANQHHQWSFFEDKVDYVIHDSPFLLSNIYIENNDNLPKQEFCDLVNKLYTSYNTFNILVENDYDYEQSGRLQDVEESNLIHDKIDRMLCESNVKFHKVRFAEVTSFVLNEIETRN